MFSPDNFDCNEGCATIENLNITEENFGNEPNDQQWIKGIVKLKELICSRQQKISGVKAVFLSLGFFDNFDKDDLKLMEANLVEVFKRLRTLKFMHLDGWHLEMENREGWIKVWDSLTNLEFLALDDMSQIVYETLEYCSPSLKTLRIGGIEKMNGFDIVKRRRSSGEAEPRFTTITTLHLHSTVDGFLHEEPDEEVYDIPLVVRHFPKLTTLYIDAYWKTLEWKEFHDVLKEISNHCPELESLTFKLEYNPCVMGPSKEIAFEEWEERNPTAPASDDFYDYEPFNGNDYSSDDEESREYTRLVDDTRDAVNPDGSEFPNLTRFKIKVRCHYDLAYRWFVSGIQKWRAFANGTGSVYQDKDEYFRYISAKPPENPVYPRELIAKTPSWALKEIFGHNHNTGIETSLMFFDEEDTDEETGNDLKAGPMEGGPRIAVSKKRKLGTS